HGRRFREGPLLVRQRMGLLQQMCGSASLVGEKGIVVAKLSIRDLEIEHKRVFTRVDFNVPLNDGQITDDTRITASLPTIRYALERRATVVLASHLGRPKGKPNPQLSLAPVARHLSELLGRPVEFVNDCIGTA